MADSNKVTVDLTTGIGTLSFPRVFPSTAQTKDDGTKSYDIQILIPKSDKESVRALLIAIQKVGKAKWGDNWKKVRQPMRDGDKEADELAEDGTRKGDKYPERLGHYFLNARSTKPVTVVDRTRTPIVEPDGLYGGCKGKINVTVYPYIKSGNQGIGLSLNGVQKIADGDSFGGGKPSVESMFDMLDDDEDLGLDEDEVEAEEPTPPPAKKAAAKKATAKKAAAKKAEPEDDIDDLEDAIGGEDEDDLFDDLED